MSPSPPFNAHFTFHSTTPRPSITPRPSTTLRPSTSYNQPLVSALFSILLQTINAIFHLPSATSTTPPHYSIFSVQLILGLIYELLNFFECSSALHAILHAEDLHQLEQIELMVMQRVQEMTDCVFKDVRVEDAIDGMGALEVWPKNTSEYLLDGVLGLHKPCLHEVLFPRPFPSPTRPLTAVTPNSLLHQHSPLIALFCFPLTEHDRLMCGLMILSCLKQWKRSLTQ